MTTGTMDFITSSGLMTPIDAIPTPDFAVPYAAPKPASNFALRGQITQSAFANENEGEMPEKDLFS